MKKLVFLAVSAFLFTGMTSCKKTVFDGSNLPWVGGHYGGPKNPPLAITCLDSLTLNAQYDTTHVGIYISAYSADKLPKTLIVLRTPLDENFNQNGPIDTVDKRQFSDTTGTVRYRATYTPKVGERNMRFRLYSYNAIGRLCDSTLFQEYSLAEEQIATIPH